jgi:hypothetical protein
VSQIRQYITDAIQLQELFKCTFDFPRFSRQIATPFTAWLDCKLSIEGNRKDVKTPFQISSFSANHVLKHVANCPSGQIVKSVAKSRFLSSTELRAARGPRFARRYRVRSISTRQRAQGCRIGRSLSKAKAPKVPISSEVDLQPGRAC